ncbi:MAG: DUF58 domain-containing protein, partial [Serpentinimonas sp.]|nr:DUF58 domain-containing protein [Serpentinimonas sp.]
MQAASDPARPAAPSAGVLRWHAPARGLRGLLSGQRLRAWWLRRLPPQDQTDLQHGNLYLLPTRAGWMLALTLL